VSLRALNANLAAQGLNPPIVLTEVNSPEASAQPSLLRELAATLPGSGCHVAGMVVHTWMPTPQGDAPSYAITGYQLNRGPEPGRPRLQLGAAGAETRGAEASPLGCGGRAATPPFAPSAER
jgi:hypothetical protein